MKKKKEIRELNRETLNSFPKAEKIEFTGEKSMVPESKIKQLLQWLLKFERIKGE